MGVISIKLQSGFVKVAFLHCCSPVGFLCRASFLQNTSGGLLLNKHNLIYEAPRIFNSSGDALLVRAKRQQF